DGLQPNDIAGLDDRIYTVYLADEQAMTGAEPTVLVVDTRRSPLRSFRVALPALASVENNLSLGNLDFDDFAGVVDKDGVFRGFTPPGAPAGEPPSPQLRTAFARPGPEVPMAIAGGRTIIQPPVVSHGPHDVIAVVAGRASSGPAAGRTTLDRMRSEATAKLQPHYDLLRAAYP